MVVGVVPGIDFRQPQVTTAASPAAHITEVVLTTDPPLRSPVETQK